MFGSKKRVRAYLLMDVRNPQTAAREIAKYFAGGGAEYVVIRADIVDCEYNLVVPVDARDEAALKNLQRIMAGVDGVKRVTVARVVEHFPKPAVEAHCYIAEDEVDKVVFKKSGRYPKSPGANPWG